MAAYGEYERMKESFKERIISAFRRTMKKYPIFRGPITVCLFFVLLVIRFFTLFSSNCKKLASLSVLCVFYMISCSFCAPVFQLDEMVEDTNPFDNVAMEHLQEEDIALAVEEEMEEIVVEVSEREDLVSTENPEIETDEDMDIDNYSMDEILAENAWSETDSRPSAGNESEEWMTLLVNKQHPIPENYEFTLGTITGNLQCDERIIPDLLDMLQAAKNDNISLVICSPYRNLDRQQMLFNRKINSYMGRGMSYMEAYKTASQAVTIPGSSEHQLGLALDIYTASYMTLDAGFGETKAGMWLREHCSEYGFILRYPEGKEYITGIEYEPWHFRYVGKEAAAYIMEQGICLEEYIDGQ